MVWTALGKGSGCSRVSPSGGWTWAGCTLSIAALVHPTLTEAQWHFSWAGWLQSSQGSVKEGSSLDILEENHSREEGLPLGADGPATVLDVSAALGANRKPCTLRPCPGMLSMSPPRDLCPYGSRPVSKDTEVLATITQQGLVPRANWPHLTRERQPEAGPHDCRGDKQRGASLAAAAGCSGEGRGMRVSPCQ